MRKLYRLDSTLDLCVVNLKMDNSLSWVLFKQSVKFPVKFPYSPILHNVFSSWIEKTMTKTIHFHWENRGCTETLPWIYSWYAFSHEEYTAVVKQEMATYITKGDDSVIRWLNSFSQFSLNFTADRNGFLRWPTIVKQNKKSRPYGSNSCVY